MEAKHSASQHVYILNFNTIMLFIFTHSGMYSHHLQVIPIFASTYLQHPNGVITVYRNMSLQVSVNRLVGWLHGVTLLQRRYHLASYLPHSAGNGANGGAKCAIRIEDSDSPLDVLSKF